MSKDSQPSDASPDEDPIRAADRCSYIAEMCGELRDLAPRRLHPTLNYFLDMARAEAELEARRLRDGRDGQ